MNTRITDSSPHSRGAAGAEHFAPRAHALEMKRMTLSNGAVLMVSEQHLLPMVTVAIAFDAGSRRDPKGKEGLAELTANSLTQGTKDLTATEFNQKVDFMGSEVRRARAATTAKRIHLAQEV